MNITFLSPSPIVDPYCWLVEMGSSRLGVHISNGWCMELSDGRLITFDSERWCTPLGPILDKDAKTFFDFLDSAAAAYPAYAESIHSFPTRLLIAYILQTSVTGYWPEKALEWLIFDKPIQPLLKDELEKFIEKKNMPQGARQKAKRILKTLQV